MPELFGCCSRYRECSEAGQCLYDDNKEFSGCSYRKNLVSGRVFYGSLSRKSELPFVITIKGDNWWSYPASSEQLQEVSSLLKRAGVLRVPQMQAPCTSRVLIDNKYLLYAPGIRLMPEAAANAIVKQLSNYESSRVEVMAEGRSVRNTEAIKKVKVPVKVTYEQLSLFDALGV